MAKRHESFIESIVLILVDKVVAGTGFVVGEGAVITCSHVVDGTPEDPVQKDAKVEIIFWEHKNGSIVRIGKSRAAQKSKKNWSPYVKHDVGLLEFSGGLPDTVKIAALTDNVVPGDTRWQTWGFPDGNRPVKGAGEVESISEEQGVRLLQLECQKGGLDKGFSGAPLFRSTDGLVVGMFSAIPTDQRNPRAANRAYAIPVATIRNVYPDLPLDPVEQAARRDRLARNRATLMTLIEVALKNQLQLCKTLDHALTHRVSTKNSSRSRVTPATVAKKLCGLDSAGRKVLVARLIQLKREFAADPARPDNKKAATLGAVRALYNAFAPVCVDEQTALKVLAQVGVAADRANFLVCESPTLFELIMAAVDGREVALRDPSSPDEPPRSQLELDRPLERGFSVKRSQDDADKYLIDQLVKAIGMIPPKLRPSVKLDATSTKGQLAQLSADLSLGHEEGRTLILNVRTAKKGVLTEADIQRIRTVLPYLMMIDIGAESGGDRLSFPDSDILTSPLRSRDFDPPPSA
jgi:hypothetical protein